MKAGVLDLKVPFAQINLFDLDIPRTSAKGFEVDNAGAVLIVIGGNAGDGLVRCKLEAGATALGLHIDADLERATK